ncbi:alanine racemase [Candidatus Uhrbacteria bacterium]|nr:alanine racemase [Candidatus Uhrbacteria bacterium]
MHAYRTWIEVSSSALAHNVRALSSCLSPDVQMIAIVKADAYGHGLREVAGLLWREGVRVFGVDSLEEALVVRECLPQATVIILGFVPDSSLPLVVSHHLHIGMYDLEQVRLLEEAAAGAEESVSVHIKIETGTARQGIFPEDISTWMDALALCPHVRVAGMYTHLARAEEIGHPMTQRQVDVLYATVGKVADRLPNLLFVHAASAAAVLAFPHAHGTAVRPGLSLYGYWPEETFEQSVRLKHPSLTLTPALSWYSRIAQVKDYPAGTPVGYGGSEVLNRPTRLAVVPVGYYDGYDRRLSSKGEVLVRGERCRVIGRVCMNMMMVDASRVPSPVRGENVTLLGTSGAHKVWADELAKRSGTITWEILARLSSHLPRLIVP